MRLGALASYGVQSRQLPGSPPHPCTQGSVQLSSTPTAQSLHSTSHSMPGSRPISFPSPGWNAAASGPSLSLSDPPLQGELSAPLHPAPPQDIPAPGLPALRSLPVFIFWGEVSPQGLAELLSAAGAGGPGPSAPPRQSSPSSHCSSAGPEAGVAESSEADNPR